MFRVIALAVVAFGVSVSVAAAEVPAGVTYEPVISARAGYVAGKPVTIYCAPTQAVWQAIIAATGDVPPGGIANGITPTIGGTVSYLAPQTCAPIHARLKKRAVNLKALGASLDILTAEGLRLRGETNGELGNGQTACDALAILPGFLVAHWGFRKNSSAYNRVMHGARAHYRQGAPSAGNC